jgi:hypothetical protein
MMFGATMLARWFWRDDLGTMIVPGQAEWNDE